jgi:hypothetical protein
MLDAAGMLSVNQTVAQIKLQEIWRPNYIIEYPVKMKITRRQKNGITTRQSREKWSNKTRRKQIEKKSFVGDATRLWNQASEIVKK